MPPTTENSRKTDPQSPSVSLRDLLRGRDISCPHCHYNLRDLTTENCPECGQELSIDRLFQPAPHFDYAWLIAWTAIVPFASWSAGYWEQAFHHPTEYFDLSDPWIVCISRAYDLAVLPIAILLLIFRRRFFRASLLIRWSFATILAAPFVYRLYRFYTTHY